MSMRINGGRSDIGTIKKVENIVAFEVGNNLSTPKEVVINGKFDMRRWDGGGRSWEGESAMAVHDMSLVW